MSYVDEVREQEREEESAAQNAVQSMLLSTDIRPDPFGVSSRDAKLSDMNVLQSRGTETEAPPSYFNTNFGEYYNEDWQKPFERAAQPYLDKTIRALKDLASKIIDRALELPSDSVFACLGETSVDFETRGACVTSQGGVYSYVGGSSSLGIDFQIGIGKTSEYLEGMSYAVTAPVATGSIGLGFTPGDPVPAVVFWSPTTEFLPSVSATYGAKIGELNLPNKPSDLFRSIEMGYGRWLNDAERQLRGQDPLSIEPLR